MRIYFEIYKNFKLSKYNNKILFLIIFSFVSLILELFSIGLLIPIIGVLFESNILNEYIFFKKIILFINPLKLIDNFSEQQNLLELTNTFHRLEREYELLDHTRRQLAARTALKDTFSNADQANN